MNWIVTPQNIEVLRDGSCIVRICGAKATCNPYYCTILLGRSK